MYVCVLDVTPVGRRPADTENSWTPVSNEQVLNPTEKIFRFDMFNV